MKNKIGIIAAGHTGRTVVAALEDAGAELILMNEPNDGSFELNGVKYAPIKTEPKKHVSSMFGRGMAMAAMLYAPSLAYLNGYEESNGYERKLPEGTDIVKEYGLIQNKQSRLSRWERDTVVRIFEKNYRRVV